MNILLENATVIPMTGGEPRYFKATVAIRDRHIAMVSQAEDAAEKFLRICPDARRIDCTGKVVMPGLVNTHCHAAMTLQRSSADDIALMEWLNDYIWPFEARQTADDIELGARLGAVEMLLGGVTSFVDMYWHESSVFNAVRDTGIRAMLTASCLDANIGACRRDVEELTAKAAGSTRITAGVSPHAAYSCSPATLLEARRLCDRYGLRMTSHLSETTDEIRMVAERYGCSPVEHFDSLGILDGLLAAHCIYVSDKDIELMARRGMSVAHNPSSNMKISSGTAPVDKMLKAGIRCTIGTDGPCSNNDLDMWEEMRNASFLQKVSTGNPLAVPAYEILKMATVSGAEAMGYGGQLGIIAEGAIADVITIDIFKPHIYPIYDLISNLVYCAKASDVETVIVDGEIVVEQRRMAGIDVGELCMQVQDAARRLSRTE